jgi:hypothetical protein
MKKVKRLERQKVVHWARQRVLHWGVEKAFSSLLDFQVSFLTTIEIPL